MRFDWSQNQKQDILKAQAAVKEAGYEDILRVDKDKFAVIKNTVKVYFQPIKREGNTRRYQAAKKAINGVDDSSSWVNTFGNRRKTVFIHAYILIDLSPRDK